jgi:solute carrier family 13 (sodium-dependent dicarboxylate transporter), member 2/3/5
MRAIILIVGLALLGAAVVIAPPAGLSQAGWITFALLVVMALWWISEVLPVTATALLPFLVLPLTGTASARDVAASYMEPVIFLVLGGSLLALAMEKWGLHRRIAVLVVKRSSAEPRALVLAFMATTAFLSMWVSNTATALIMMPIAVAIVLAVLPDREQWTPAERAFVGALVLGIAYSASIGGLGTLLGSPTNGIAVGLIDKTLGIKITFLEWLTFGVPLVLMSIPVGWWLLTRLAFRFDLQPFDRQAVLRAIGDQGAMSAPERRLVPLLLAAVAAWIAMPFLKELPALGALEDAHVAIVAAMLLFVIPDGRGGRLLEWSDTPRAPWDVLTLFGGGLALAAAITSTGLGKWIGGELSALDALPLLAIILAFTLVVIVVTEFASNVAAAASFVPVVAGVAGVMEVDPLWLVIPAALAATWGFMMPSGTPPNAIAFATGYVRIREMVRAGLWIDLLGMIAIPLATWIALTVFR